MCYYDDDCHVCYNDDGCHVCYNDDDCHVCYDDGFENLAHPLFLQIVLCWLFSTVLCVLAFLHYTVCVSFSPLYCVGLSPLCTVCVGFSPLYSVCWPFLHCAVCWLRPPFPPLPPRPHTLEPAHTAILVINVTFILIIGIKNTMIILNIIIVFIINFITLFLTLYQYLGYFFSA